MMVIDTQSQLERDEDTVLHAYPDSMGYLTIGTGRLIDVRKGGGISQSENDLLLNNDIVRCTSEIDTALPWADELGPVRKGVLVNMCFQLGLSGLLGFRQMLQYAHAGNFQAASKSMLQSIWAHQTPQRAYRLSQQMLLNQWQ